MIKNFLEEVIHGDKLADFAHVSINWPRKSHNIENVDNSNQIIFCKTDYIDDLFKDIENSDNKHILITHNSDFVISEEIYRSKPKCIKKWYAENVFFSDKDLIPIPLGVERPDGMGYSSDMTVLDKVLNTDRNLKNIVYSCINIDNNPKYRLECDKFASEEMFVTRQEYGVPFDEFILNIYNHVFTLCPRGNGIDTHRLWETLYLGGIPVTERNVCTESFQIVGRLPILLVDNWDELNLNMLLNTIKKFSCTEFNSSYLKLSYWKDRIQKDYMELCK